MCSYEIRLDKGFGPIVPTPGPGVTWYAYTEAQCRMSKIQISKAMTNARGTACKYNEPPSATVHIAQKDYKNN